MSNLSLKYKDTLDLYDDHSNCIAKEVPLQALSPLYNPYMREVLNLFKRTAFIDLAKLEQYVKSGRAGWETVVGQDEIQMPWYGRDLPMVERSEEIAERIKEKIAKFDDGEEELVKPVAGGKLIIVKIPRRMMEVSASRDPPLTWTMVALCQAISETFNLNPETDPDGCNMVRGAIFGRYPQSPELPPGGPVFGLLRQSNIVDGLGSGFRGIMVNHIVALVNKRTMDGVALATILEQGAQWEMGNVLGWFERYNLLASAYQGFNANNLVLDLVLENREGTIGDVARSTVKRAVEDGVIKVKKTFPSGYKVYSTSDYPLWNAYGCAGVLAAVIVNVGASRAAQSVSTVTGYFGDHLIFETGGLPDPDTGRIEGTGIGYAFYTHSIYGGAGPGAYTLDHVVVRSTSGFLTPCVVAGMCLDSGTQLFSPEMTSSALFKIRDHMPLLNEPLKKVAEAAEKVKGELTKA
ncbi:MAG: Methyl-coenzyme M reductase II subunit beta [Candidatus Bathyarchaeota archaeon BA2]|uniref:coenzyme-B sulfoethylthiotransferase n=1 Tax=uncultured Bathyarchaeota archaeon TaxID=1739975 RepID=A0A0P0K431_9ARCH|nr:methyl-coenzyme M reductase subunit beta [uncultured Bathyarchaeota archaeon]KPV61799.1 MAG: Methyl-coenzyme M reductase II subunit beta [Candidatus Bathyarchaeota archaeon BA2]